MTDEANPIGDPTAAELALGLLEGDERAAALRHTLADRAFAAEVDYWREHFGQLFDLWPEQAVDDSLLRRIEAGIDGGAAPARWQWPAALAVASIAAALVLASLFSRPDPPQPQPQPRTIVAAPGPMLAAALAGEDLDPVTAVYRPDAGELRLTGFAAERGRSAQLWAIGEDGVPRPLGLLETGATRLALDPARRARIAEGVTLAISIEPIGGSPTGLPTGPVVATGKLDQV